MSEYTETHIPNSDEELEEYLDETLRLLNENTAKQLENQHEQNKPS